MSILEPIRRGAEQLVDILGEAWDRLRQRSSAALTRFRHTGEENEAILPALHRSDGWGLLASDIAETDHEVVVRVEAPGLDQKDFSVSVVADELNRTRTEAPRTRRPAGALSPVRVGLRRLRAALRAALCGGARPSQGPLPQRRADCAASTHRGRSEAPHPREGGLSVLVIHRHRRPQARGEWSPHAGGRYREA